MTREYLVINVDANWWVFTTGNRARLRKSGPFPTRNQALAFINNTVAPDQDLTVRVDA